jgi:adenine phosphoribosyltransferase
VPEHAEGRMRALVRDVPDFPRAGIVYKDITPLLGDPSAFAWAVGRIVEHAGPDVVDTVVGIEARGYALAAPVACCLGAGFVPIRKEGKLPAACERQEYSLEYGSAVMEIHADAIGRGERVLIVEDLLATGGTARAAVNLIERLGGRVVGIACLVELTFLRGRDRLAGYDLFTLLPY